MMKLKIITSSAIFLLSSCAQLGGTKTTIDYSKPSADTEQYKCMKKCKTHKDVCDHTKLSGYTIISKRDTNECLNKEILCLKSCGITVEIKKEKVNMFGFSSNNTLGINTNVNFDFFKNYKRSEKFDNF